MNSNYVVEPNVPFYFDMNLDAEGLVRRDAAVEVDNDTVSVDAASYLCCANTWCLIFKDRVSAGAGDRLARLISAKGLTSIIKDCDESAEFLMHGGDLEDVSLVAPLLDRFDNKDEATAEAIKVLKYPKRFSAPKPVTAIEGLALSAFETYQQEDLRKSVTEARSLFYHELISRQRDYLSDAIGTAPDLPDLNELSPTEAKFSPGVGLLDAASGLTSRLRSRKLAAIKQGPDFNLDVSKIGRKSMAQRIYCIHMPTVTVITGKVTPAVFPWEEPTYTMEEENVTDVYTTIEDSKSHYNGHEGPAVAFYIRDRESRCLTIDVNGVAKLPSTGLHHAGGAYERVELSYLELHSSLFPIQITSELIHTTYFGLTRNVREHVIMITEVPKSFKIKRLIGIDHPRRISNQLYVKDQMERAILASDYSRQMPIQDQSVNRELSWFGSKTGLYATTDITSASDGLTVLSAKAFPGGWQRAFDRTRPTAYVEKGQKVTSARSLYSNGPMGCGWTFHSLTGFCFSLGMVARDIAIDLGFLNLRVWRSRLTTWKKDHPDEYRRIEHLWPLIYNALPVHYGDDAVVPTPIASTYLGLLEVHGLIVNPSKSFIDGKFREACGGDFYGGYDATPVYYPRSGIGTLEKGSDGRYAYKSYPVVDWVNGDTVLSSSLAKLISLQHNLYEFSPSANAWLTQFILKLFPNMTFSKAGTDCTDLWGAYDVTLSRILVNTEKGTDYVEYTPDDPRLVRVYDDVTGKEVLANVREGHYVLSTSYSRSEPWYSEADGNPVGEGRQIVEQLLLEKFLKDGPNIQADAAIDYVASCCREGADFDLVDREMSFDISYGVGTSRDPFDTEPTVVWTLSFA